MTPESNRNYNQIAEPTNVVIAEIQKEIEESPTFGPLVLTERFNIKIEKSIPPEYQTDQEIIGFLDHQDNHTTLYMPENLDFTQWREVVLKSVLRYIRIKEKSPQANFSSKIYPHESPLTSPEEYLYDLEAAEKFLASEKKIENACCGTYNIRGITKTIAEGIIVSPKIAENRLIKLCKLPLLLEEIIE